MLIGISGFARSGKDTIASMLIDHGAMTNKKFYKYSFASPIKEACHIMFDWDKRHTDGELKEVTDYFWGISPRKAMQLLGTEWGRDLINPKMWILRAQKMHEKHEYLVIPDVRFKNELDFIRERKGHIIFVNRPGVEAVSRHTSETGLEQYKQESDFSILNNGTFENLNSEVTRVFNSILEREKSV